MPMQIPCCIAKHSLLAARKFPAPSPGNLEPEALDSAAFATSESSPKSGQMSKIPC
jgi:hypothetical protein